MASDSREVRGADSYPLVGTPEWWESEDPGGVGTRAWAAAFESACARRAPAMLSADWGRVVTAREALAVPTIVAQLEKRATTAWTISRAVEDADSQVPELAKIRSQVGTGPLELLARAAGAQVSDSSA
jgi:hypothetical protein